MEKEETLQLINIVVLIVASFLFVGLGVGSYHVAQTLTEDEDSESSDSLEEAERDVDILIGKNELEKVLSDADRVNNNITISSDDNYYYIESNGLPNHDTGNFPNSNNPNTISEQTYEYRVTKNPTKMNTQTPVSVFGVALGGIPFEPETTQVDQATGWMIEAIQPTFDIGLDFNNALVNPSGAYHYKGIPESLVGGDSAATHSSLVGFATDGFPIYARYGFSDVNDNSSIIVVLESSWQLKEGARAEGEPTGNYDGTYTNDFEYIDGSGDLDQCNGRQTVTPEYPDGTYAYYLTDTFPYIPRCVFGTPDESFEGSAPLGAFISLQGNILSQQT